MKWNTDGTITPGCVGSFSPSAATNQLNRVTDVVQLSQIYIIAIPEAIQQVHHNNEPIHCNIWFSIIELIMFQLQLIDW